MAKSAPLKTQKNAASVAAFIERIPDTTVRNDCIRLIELMREISGKEPAMWGASMVGFGQYHYRYATGREGDWFMIGFSPRKKNLTLYLMDGVDHHQAALSRLGKHTVGKSCVYIHDLSTINLTVLRSMLQQTITTLSTR